MRSLCTKVHTTGPNPATGVTFRLISAPKNTQTLNQYDKRSLRSDCLSSKLRAIEGRGNFCTRKYESHTLQNFWRRLLYLSQGTRILVRRKFGFVGIRFRFRKMIWGLGSQQPTSVDTTLLCVFCSSLFLSKNQTFHLKFIPHNLLSTQPTVKVSIMNILMHFRENKLKCFERRPSLLMAAYLLA